jgi:hypothetical protein
MYKCGWNGCEKAYGTLNHLNAHVTMQGHGAKRTPEGELYLTPFSCLVILLRISPFVSGIVFCTRCIGCLLITSRVIDLSVWFDKKLFLEGQAFFFIGRN